MSLSFDELRQANLEILPKFKAGGLDDWNIAEWMNAVAGETGEACNFAKKHIRQLPSDPPRGVLEKAIAYELADIVIYVDLVAAKLGVNLGDIVKEKFNLVCHRMEHDQRL